jgi:hypothetical protein
VPKANKKGLVLVSFRVEPDAKERCQKLWEKEKQRGVGRMYIADVYRWVMEKGLQAIEEEA